MGTGVPWGRCSSSPSGGCPCPKSLTSGVHLPLTSGGGTSAKEGLFFGGGDTRGQPLSSSLQLSCRVQPCAPRPPVSPPAAAALRWGTPPCCPPRRASIGPIGRRAGVEGGGNRVPELATDGWRQLADTCPSSPPLSCPFPFFPARFVRFARGGSSRVPLCPPPPTGQKGQEDERGCGGSPREGLGGPQIGGDTAAPSCSARVPSGVDLGDPFWSPRGLLGPRPHPAGPVGAEGQDRAHTNLLGVLGVRSALPALPWSLHSSGPETRSQPGTCPPRSSSPPSCLQQPGDPKSSWKQLLSTTRASPSPAPTTPTKAPGG